MMKIQKNRIEINGEWFDVKYKINENSIEIKNKENNFIALIENDFSSWYKNVRSVIINILK